MFNLPRLVPPQPTTQTVATRAKRERKTLLFSFLFHKVSLPFSTYTYRLLIKPLNVLSKRRIGRKKPERIVFPSFCIHSIHFTFHRKYRRAIIFEKAFSPPKENSTPSDHQGRKSSSNDVAIEHILRLLPEFHRVSFSGFLEIHDLLTEEAGIESVVSLVYTHLPATEKELTINHSWKEEKNVTMQILWNFVNIWMAK